MTAFTADMLPTIDEALSDPILLGRKTLEDDQVMGRNGLDAARLPRAPAMSLTAKQCRFVQEFLIDLNASRAAVRAGYSARTAAVIGHENLRKPAVAEAIADAQRAVAEKLDVTVERVVSELANLAFSNVLDFGKIKEHGQVEIDLGRVTRDQAAAISEVTTETRRVPGTDATVTRTKLKLADKRAALVDLGRHLGAFRERGAAADHPLHVVEVGDSQRLAALALLVARAGLPKPKVIA